MKKKSIFVVALAALMLIAFTACEQQVPNIPLEGDNDIANVIVNEAPTFYAGTSVNTGYGTITVERVGGKTTSNITALFTVSLAEDALIAPGTNPVEITFGTNNNTKWTTTIESVTLESIAVVSETYKEGTEVSAPSDVKLSSVIGTYTDGKTIDLLPNGTYAKGVAKSLDVENSAIVVTAAAGIYSADEVKGTLDVTVKEAEAPFITKVEVTYGDEDTEVIVGQEFRSDLVKVVATYGSGVDAEEVTLTEGQYTLNIAKHTFTAADKTANTNKGLKLTAVVVNPPANSTETSGDCYILPVDDYIDSFSVTVAKDQSAQGDTKPDYTVAPGSSISQQLNKFVFTADSMAVANEVPEGKKNINSSSIEVNPAYNVVPEGFTGTFVTYFTLKASANSGHAIENVRCTIEVVAPASAG